MLSERRFHTGTVELKGTPDGRLRMTRTDTIESVGKQVSKFRLVFYGQEKWKITAPSLLAFSYRVDDGP